MKVLLLGFLFCGFVYSFDWDVETPLDKFIKRDDGAFAWTSIREDKYENFTHHVLNLTSQYWKNDSWSDAREWYHYLHVMIPKEIEFTEGSILWIEGGRRGGTPPTVDNNVFLGVLSEICQEVKGIVSMLQMIPYQPIVYGNDPEQKRRTEDDSIAYTWRQYIDNPEDPEILLQFPSTKAAVKALDAIQEFTKQARPETNINKFLVAGGSKRGWISWLLGCVDKRINAMAPVVLTAVNFQENLRRHWRAYGGWSFALNDYYRQNITKYLNEPVVTQMMSHIDPYSYRERLTMPKVIVAACGDEFFRPDDSHVFFDGLPEPKYMLLLANAQHTVVGSYHRVINTLQALFIGVNTPGYQLPKFSWERGSLPNGGYIRLTSNDSPYEVNAVSAETGERSKRDFRLVTGIPPYVNPVLWDWESANNTGPGVWEARYNEEEDVYVGLIMEAHFNGPREDTHFEFTTEIQVIPDTFPFENCVGEECHGELL